MSATAKKIIIAVIIAVIALTALGLGAWGVSMYFVPFGDDSAEGYTISFDSDTILMRSGAVTASERIRIVSGRARHTAAVLFGGRPYG